MTRGFSLLCTLLVASSGMAADRPNIVWISCEDISCHLACYGDPNATTPNLDKLAGQGVRYTRAFTCHGVCAPSRTGIITAMYPIGIGANHMRSKATLPKQIRCFPEYLRQAGYYCTNNSKTDYNFHWNQKDVWDESSNKAHWKNRSNSDQPFFAVFNLTMSHESKIWPKGWQNVVKNVPEDQLHNPDSIRIPKLYPDTPEVRAAHARLLDIIMVMDQTVGRYLKELDDAGLTDDTIVIFWSDHGNGFARAKRWIYDTGTLVPMIARIPDRFRAEGQGTPGSVDDQLINLIDLGPTTLNLAGIPVAENMMGQPFLGAKLPEPRQYIYGARDRIDERFDMVRSVRDSRYRYVRNLNSWRPALQFIEYSERSVVRQEMRRLFAEGSLHQESAQFLVTPRPAEELYDLSTDPFELQNLAADPAQADTLKRLRRECTRWQLEVRDAHLLPEIILDEEEKQQGSRWEILHSRGGRRRARGLLQAAIAAQGEGPLESLKAAAGSDDAAARWWGLTGLANQSAIPDSTVETFRSGLKDSSAAVRLAAARGMYRAGHSEAALKLLIQELDSNNEFVRHAAVVEIDEMGADGAPAQHAIQTMNQSSGYIRNIAAHALSQFPGNSTPVK